MLAQTDSSSGSNRRDHVTIDVADTPAPLNIRLSSDLQPIGLSDQVRQVLQGYFNDWTNREKLPDSLAAWVSRSSALLRPDLMLGPLQAFSIESVRGRLLVRYFPRDRDGVTCLIMVEVPAVPNFSRLRRMGLTLRECEVMHWMARGKRDAEIATIIGTATKTVGKHVEHALRKFRAPNRTTAVRAAVEWLESETNIGKTDG
jgi:DNA-binding CsgD family transcriptional regulator